MYIGNGARLGMYARLYARTYRHTCTPFGVCFLMVEILPLYIFRYIAFFRFLQVVDLNKLKNVFFDDLPDFVRKLYTLRR